MDKTPVRPVSPQDQITQFLSTKKGQTLTQEDIQVCKDLLDRSGSVVSSNKPLFTPLKTFSSGSTTSTIKTLSKIKISKRPVQYFGSGIHSLTKRPSKPLRQVEAKKVKLEEKKPVSSAAMAILETLEDMTPPPTSTLTPFGKVKPLPNPYLSKPMIPTQPVFSPELKKQNLPQMPIVEPKLVPFVVPSVPIKKNIEKNVEMEVEPVIKPIIKPFEKPIITSSNPPIVSTPIIPPTPTVTPTIARPAPAKKLEPMQVDITIESTLASVYSLPLAQYKFDPVAPEYKMDILDLVLVIPSTELTVYSFESKPEIKLQGLGFNWQAAGVAPTSKGWTCSICMVSNKAEATKCAACESDKPADKPASTPSSGGFNWQAAGVAPSSKGWTCSICMVSNKAEAKKCIACESDKPTEKPVSTPSSGGFNWQAAGVAPTSKGWTCSICMVSNKAEAKKCAACESEK